MSPLMPRLPGREQQAEPLGLLLLPTRLEEFERRAHAQALLQIPRVIALEPPRFRTPRLLRDAAPVRQAKRLRLPGAPRVIVLYDPDQYRLARALLARYDGAELWYLRREPSDGAEGEEPDPDWLELDRLALERAGPPNTFTATEAAEEPLRERLRETGIISSRPFIPGARVERR